MFGPHRDALSMHTRPYTIVISFSLFEHWTPIHLFTLCVPSLLILEHTLVCGTGRPLYSQILDEGFLFSLGGSLRVVFERGRQIVNKEKDGESTKFCKYITINPSWPGRIYPLLFLARAGVNLATPRPDNQVHLHPICIKSMYGASSWWNKKKIVFVYYFKFFLNTEV